MYEESYTQSGRPAIVARAFTAPAPDEWSAHVVRYKQAKLLYFLMGIDNSGFQGNATETAFRLKVDAEVPLAEPSSLGLASCWGSLGRAGRHKSLLGAISMLVFGLVIPGPAVLGEQHLQTLDFGGIKWNIRQAGIDSGPVQPGNNYFSSAYGPEGSVYVDEFGRLHLAVDQRASVWHSAEVSSDSHVLDGLYRFRITLPNEPPLDPKVAVAIFLYSDETHEFDIEISQFLSQFDCSLIDCDACVSQCPDCQLQFVRQPFCETGNWQRFAWPNPIRESIHEIMWEQGETVRLSSSEQGPLAEHTITHTFPIQTDEADLHVEYHLHLSIWLMDEGGPQHSNSPSKLSRQEVIFEALELPVEMVIRENERPGQDSLFDAMKHEKRQK